MNSDSVVCFEVVFSVSKNSYLSFSISIFIHGFFLFFFFSLGALIFARFLVSVKMPAKSVWWAVCLGTRWGPWHQPIWGPHCCRHRVQTNSHGNPSCGTPFSVSPRGPSPPPGSPPVPSWHRSGSYPSNWQEKRQQALVLQQESATSTSSIQEAKPRVEAIPESGRTENTSEQLTKTQPVKIRHFTKAITNPVRLVGEMNKTLASNENGNMESSPGIIFHF